MWAEFDINGEKFRVQCRENEVIKDVYTRCSSKFQKPPNVNKVNFLYNGNVTQPSLQLSQIVNNLDRSRNQLSIIVTENVPDYIRHDNYVCPDCFTDAYLTHKNFKFNLSCKYGHKHNNLSADEFRETQKIETKKIICGDCKENNLDNCDESTFFRCNKWGNKIINVAVTSDIEKLKRGEVLEINDVTKEFTLGEDGMSYTKAYDIKEINWVAGEDGKKKREEGNVSAKGTLTLTTDGNILTGASRKITEVSVNGKDFVTPDAVSSLPSGNSAIKVGDKYYGFDADNKWVELVAGANIVTLKDENGVAQKQYTVESKQDWNIVLNDGMTKYGLNYNEHNYGTDESTLVKSINFDILGINYNGKWYEDSNLNDVLTMPDGSGSLVSVKISDNDGNYLWDAYFALSNGAWVSSYSMKVGNYTAIKNLDTNETCK